MAVVNFLAPDAGPVSSKIAIALIKYYRDHDGWPSNEARSIWFSYDDFLEMIQLIHQEHDTDFGKLRGDGMRVYFGRYPHDGSLDPKERDFKGKKTVVLVPTIPINGRHKDIFDVTKLTEQDADHSTLDDDPNQGFNHGELCPPNTGCP